MKVRKVKKYITFLLIKAIGNSAATFDKIRMKVVMYNTIKHNLCYLLKCHTFWKFSKTEKSNKQKVVEDFMIIFYFVSYSSSMTQKYIQ